MDKKNIANNLISATLGGAACVGVDKLVSLFVDETKSTSDFDYTPAIISSAIGVALPMIVKGSTSDKIGDAILAVQMYKIANHLINDSSDKKANNAAAATASTSGLGRMLPSQRAIGLMPSSNHLLPSQQAVGKVGKVGNVVKNNVK